MISPPGVLIPADWCAEVAQHLGGSLRIDHRPSPKLLEICDQLAAVGAAVSAASARGSPGLISLPAPPHTSGMTVAAYANTVDLTTRRVRQMCAAGDIDARKIRGQWVIETEREEDNI